jgi:hypothetical protein
MTNRWSFWKFWLPVCCLAGCSIVGAQTKPSSDEAKLQELREQRQAIERAQAALAALEKSAELISATYKYECMAAVGHAPLCDCLSTNTPMSVNFAAYVAIVTTNKVKIEYDKFSKDDKDVYDATVKARDKCVAAAFPGR